MLKIRHFKQPPVSRCHWCKKGNNDIKDKHLTKDQQVFFITNISKINKPQNQSWAPQAQVLGSRYLKDYILSSWFVLELSAQNLVLDLKYTKRTWPFSHSYTNLANSLIFLSKPTVFSQNYQQNNVDVCSFHWSIVKK